MNRSVLNYVVTAAGLLLLGVGLYLIKGVSISQEIIALPYICIGVGCGAFGHGMGNIISKRALKNHPDIQRQIEIEKKDERNIAIGSRAKAKAFDIMVFVFGALMVSFAMMGVELVAVLLLVFSYLLVIGCGVYYRCKYDKEM